MLVDNTYVVIILTYTHKGGGDCYILRLWYKKAYMYITISVLPNIQSVCTCSKGHDILFYV